MVFLQGVGVSTAIAVRIYKKYAEKSIDVVKAEPHRLAADVWGIGFTTADTIAQAVGIPHDSPERVKVGLRYTLSQATDSGHCYLPADRPVAEATKILDVPSGLGELDDLVACVAGRSFVRVCRGRSVVRRQWSCGRQGPRRCRRRTGRTRSRH
jgi:exodeoxyribonuclease V alpha subunit